MANGVTQVNGLQFGVAANRQLVKHPTLVWSGVASASGTAGWGRFEAAGTDTGAVDSTESQVRLDFAIAVSGSDLNLSSTTFTSGATQTISGFSVSLPSA